MTGSGSGKTAQIYTGGHCLTRAPPGGYHYRPPPGCARMDLDEIKEHLDRLFATRDRTSPRQQAAGLREALVEFKIGIGQMRDALARSERDLEQARKESTDYERRGQLAAGIGDAETTRIAAEFTAKAHERVDLLERKVIVQRDELAIAERDYDATMKQYQSASRGVPLDAGAAPSAPDAPGDSSGLSALDAALLEQRAKEATVEAQLAHLKKKMGEGKS